MVPPGMLPVVGFDVLGSQTKVLRNVVRVSPGLWVHPGAAAKSFRSSAASLGMEKVTVSGRDETGRVERTSAWQVTDKVSANHSRNSSIGSASKVTFDARAESFHFTPEIAMVWKSEPAATELALVNSSPFPPKS